VKLIRSGTRDDIDLPTTGTAHLRGITARLNFRFLHSIGRRAEIERVECWIGIGGAIQKEVVRIRPIAANAHCRPLSRAPVQRASGTALGAMARVPGTIKTR
jgi:hypothetical protein